MRQGLIQAALSPSTLTIAEPIISAAPARILVLFFMGFSFLLLKKHDASEILAPDEEPEEPAESGEEEA